MLPTCGQIAPKMYDVAMRPGQRQAMAIAGGCIAGAALAAGWFATLTAFDNFLSLTTLVASVNTQLPWPALSSPAVIVAGAFLGLGVGLMVASFIRDDPN